MQKAVKKDNELAKREQSIQKVEKKKEEVVNWRTPFTRISEEDDHIVLVVEVPGIKKDQVEMRYVENKLIIEAKSDRRAYRKSFLFRKTPDVEKIEAELENGLLKIKVAPLEPASINIPVK